MSAPSPLPSTAKRPPGTLAERFWSIVKSAGQSDDETSPEPRAVVRHVLRILDALASGEVGDALSQSTVSFLQLLRQQEQAGDLSYASPEQARGESLDERSLVFSIGVLLFEELTGRHPFGAMASGRRFARIQKCELGSGVQFFPQVPAQLRNVLMKAMGPFPEERYRSLKEMREHLERFVDGRPDETPGRAAARRPLKGLVPTPADLGLHARRGAGADARRAPPRNARGGDAAGAADQGRSGARRVGDARPGDSATPVATAPTRSSRCAACRGRGRSSSARRGSRAARWWRSSLRTSRCGRRRRAARRRRRRERRLSQPVATPLAPARNVEPPSLASDTPEPTTFDADLSGRNAAKAARECFTPERATHTISFGAGLLFAKDEAVSRRTYLSPDEPLQPDERRCINHALVGVSAGAAPSHNTIVEYRFRLRPDGSNEVKAAIQK